MTYRGKNGKQYVVVYTGAQAVAAAAEEERQDSLKLVESRAVAPS
jgi:hypothetical protein